jgi:hypothetical protein
MSDMNWIEGATNYCDLCCNFLNIFTDQFEELGKEEGIKFQIPKDQRKLVELEVRVLPLQVDSWR